MKGAERPEGKRHFLKIRQSLYLALLAFTLLPILGFGLTVLRTNNQRVETLMTESLQVAANLQVSKMQQFCMRVEESMQSMGQIPEVCSLMMGEAADDRAMQSISDVLAARVAATDYLESITILSRDFRILVCTKETDQEYANDFGALQERIASGELYFSNVVTPRDNQNVDEIFAIIGVFDQGQLIGYVLEEVNLDFYESVRTDPNVWEDATVYILDGNRRIITAGTAQAEREDFVTSQEERADYLEKYNAIDFEEEPTGHIKYTVNGRRYITYYANVEHSDWRLMISVDIGQFQQQTESYEQLFIGIAIFCCLLGVWINRFTTQRIMRPVSTISGILRKVQEEQDYTCRVPPHIDDEIGAVAGEINALLDYIEQENLQDRQRRRELMERAQQDALTKVLNRETITHQVEQALEEYRQVGVPFAVLFVDVDDFKSFNTQYGHAVGDQVLMFVTKILAEQTRGAVGRMGGDEFLVVVRDPVVLENLNDVLREVISEMSRWFYERNSGQTIPVACSIGVARPQRPETTAEELIAESDKRMYRVKNSGKQGFSEE